MPNIAPIYQAIEFIEDHLRQAVTVADIADAASYSLYHFCRMFNQATHHSPYDYLMRRRLSESARDLLATDKKVIEIALDYQFNSPEAYSRAFKRMFNMQPTRWKRRGSMDRRFLMSRLTREHIAHRNRGGYLRPVLENKNALQLAGLMTLVKVDACRASAEVADVMPAGCRRSIDRASDDPATIAQLWEVFAQELKRAGVLTGPVDYYGIVYHPQGWERRGFLYIAAVETAILDLTGSALVSKTIPPLRCARFVHKGPYKNRHLTLDYVYQTWLPQSGQRLSHPLEIECHGRDFQGLDAEDAERAILIPVEPVES
jgi:AraC family transcriptional regulator